MHSVATHACFCLPDTSCGNVSFNNVLATETPLVIVESYKSSWIDNNVPSPSPHDAVTEKDIPGNCIRICEEYKKEHVEHDYEQFGRWRFENAEVIEEHLTSQGKRGNKTNVRTFKHYKQNHVKQTVV